MALTASDVTVTISNRHKERIAGGMRKVIADIKFGDGAETYPTGGVPLPAKEQFGFKREIALGMIEQPSANGFVYKFDRSNHKIKIFTMGFVTSATGSSLIQGNAPFVENSAGADTQMMIAGATVADTTYDMGPLIELPAALAPAEVTLRVKFEGE
jgi:hypothetical protein